MYALIEFAGKQFRVEEGDSIMVPYIGGKVGSKVLIDKILYMDDGKNKAVGNPTLKGIKIDGEIGSHGRGRKVVVFKFKRRKGYQKKNTHRQKYSILKIGKLGKATDSKAVNKKAESKTVEKKVAPKKAVSTKKAESKTAKKKVAPKKAVTTPKPAVIKTTTSKPKEAKE
ncbi:uncharacterized protein METZ01_LOCUS170159 [marine metagenome]|uniref:50S ribosomal protein L21 n=1 Tax=marine metagenome TaxID=408172 RepID=A0A382BU20_9ZZZZ